MSRSSQSAIAVAIVAAILLVAAAFWFAPRACEGGLEAYLMCGVAVLAVMFALPFILRMGDSLLLRAASALGLVVLGAAFWVARSVRRQCANTVSAVLVPNDLIRVSSLQSSRHL
jgi:hypothetical protein